MASCRQTKHVPEGKYLVKKNKIHVQGDALEESDLEEIIRQPANFKTLGLKLKLRAYNLVDSSKVSEKRIRKNNKLDRINHHKRLKQKKINDRRIERARKKNSEYYTKKIIPLKDTLNPRLFVKEWLKYKYGEPPVIFDSTLFTKTIEQHGNYLKKKGYYEGNAEGQVIYNKHKKAKVKYFLTTGPRLFIDSVIISADNPFIAAKYQDYLNTAKLESIKGEPFDRDFLDEYRTTVAKRFRDDTYFGFSTSNINFVVDTNDLINKGLIIHIKFSDRVLYHPDFKDSVVTVQHQNTMIRNVYFHISDTNLFQGNFVDTVRRLGLNLMDGQFVNCIDTFRYQEILEKGTEQLDVHRMATFLFNEKLFVEPGILESQNYLEEGEKYKEYYIDRTYTRLVQLGLFQSIKPKIVEVFGTNLLDVHYYLIPSEKESFGFEPRATNSNGYFGLTASVYYLNNNLFGGAQKLRLALTGGFESQPVVFDPTLSVDQASNLQRSFNTLEFGPSFIFDVPGLFPTKVTALTKRHRPRTVVSAAYNFQRREEFSRQTLQANYMWKMFVGKTQVFQYGLPMLSSIKFVNINKSTAFQDQLNIQNDLFLRNTYSDQFIWQDWKFLMEFKNQGKDNFNPKKDFQIYYNGSFDAAGNLLSAFRNYQDTSVNGKLEIFGVPYSRFVRLDNDFIISKLINRTSSGHVRLIAGGGIPQGEKETSLPFDYSFSAGGSNDNRGWKARSLGPGSYKYMLDTNRTLTQVADIRIAGSVEYRFAMSKSLKGAFFMDAGNIWTYKEDVNRPGSQFTKDWYKEIAYSAGFGVRIDLEYFILRFDLGIPLNNVSLPRDSRWVWQSRQAMIDELINTFGQADYERLKLEGKIPNPFSPGIRFGIGYPF